MSKPIVAHLIASGYSGSTLLTHFLGAHSDILNLGEVLEAHKTNRDCRCVYCNESCEIWDLTIGRKGFLRNVNAFFFANFGRLRRLKRLALGILGQIFPDLLPGAIYHKIFRSQPHLKVVLDGSKTLKWSNWQSRNAKFDHRYIFLVRDFRALVASRQRKLNESFAESVSIIQRRYRNNEAYFEALPKEKRMMVKYEDLVLNPERTGTDLCRFLGLEYETEMEDYPGSRQHILGGSMTIMMRINDNQGKDSNDLKFSGKESYKGSGNFFLDERWRSELSEARLSEMKTNTEAFSRKYGYQ